MTFAIPAPLRVSGQLILVAGVLTGMFSGSADAQLPEMQSVHSSSKQFVARTPKTDVPPSADVPANGPRRVRLTPEIVAISAERVKRDYLRLLGLRDNWRSKIIFTINPEKPVDETVLIFSERFIDGWRYHIEVPPYLDEVKFVRLLINALLQERANRNATNRSVELPLWLTEGFALYLINEYPRELLLEAQASAVVPVNAWVQALANDPTSSSRSFFPIDSSPVQVAQERIDPLNLLMRAFQEHEPLSFNELSFPDSMPENSDEWLLYQFSANLFVLKLLEFQEGKNALVRTLDLSSQVLNWQTAFLEGFSNRFETLLDVEKWWTLTAFEFKTIGIFETDTGSTFYALSSDIGLARLKEVLNIEANGGGSDDDSAPVTYLSLQELIRETGSEEDRAVIEQVFAQLTILSSYCDPGLAPLVASYAEVLSAYLNGKPYVSTTTARILQMFSGERAVTASAISRLDELDSALESLSTSGTSARRPLTSAQIERLMQTP